MKILNNNKLVSIILPTYNGEKFIRESVESVLSQTYQNWELIIINDCSTDNTLEIINEYKAGDTRIKVFSNEINKKLPSSLNIGFSNAVGDYYTWTSDDNFYKPTAIEKMVQFLDDNPQTDLVSFNFDFINENGEFLYAFSDIFPKRDLLQHIRSCNIGACFMYRKEIAQKVGEYDVSMFCAEDYDYWCRIALEGNISYENDNLYVYRFNELSLTSTRQETIIDRSAQIRLRYTLPIMNKLNISKKEKVWALFDLYQLSKDKRWLNLSYKVCSLRTFIKYLNYKIGKYIYSKTKNDDKITYIFLGIKITLKRKIYDKITL